ncbi:60S ribosomal protein L37a-like [Phyllostomus discolor]|uniref:60S ribosomal protein L37a-like n=1 Tax=Phyllostomus discolor TaxID=89673 RepID=A0A6J2LXW5_9CHIR|nr:60S ribosomal protein L37a-like [Phyllostomus discolor]
MIFKQLKINISSLGSYLVCNSVTKRAEKFGIVSKYGSHDGSCPGIMAKKIGISQHTKYTCSFCCEAEMKRRAVGIWPCGSCMTRVAGAAWTYHPTSALTVKSALRRLKESKDQ